MNLGQLVRSAVKKYTDKIAIIEGDERFTFEQFYSRVNALANSFRKILELHTGDRVALLLNNRHQYMEARLALEKCGIVWIPLNTLLGGNEIDYIIRDSDARVLITEKDFIPKISQTVSELKLATVWVGPQAQGLRGYDFESLISDSNNEDLLDNVDYDALCSLNYTSGTTGKPKGVMLSHRNWINVYRNMLVDRDIRPDDILAHIGPLTHASGSYFLPYFLKGATNLIIQGGFNLEVFLKTIEEQKITAFTCVPTMLIRLLNFPGLSNYNLKSLRNIGYGAAPMPTEVIKKAIETFGPIFTQNYGQTEAYMTITNLPKEEHIVEGSEDEVKRLASVGRPYTFVEVKVVDDEGKEVLPGEPGELIVRSEHVMQGYWKLPEETAKSIKDGWLYTGDVAKVDKDGYIFLVDRKKDMIISGGFNIYPREIEEVIYKHPSVLEAAVIGVPDSDWGEMAKAFVVLKEGCQATAQEISTFCKQKIGFKYPRIVDVLQEMPKNSAGKIDKKVLREAAGGK